MRRETPSSNDAMMDKMFSAMSAEDRIRFVTTMMPKCLNIIFEEIEPDMKMQLAQEMITKMMSIFKEQLEGKGG